MKKQIWIALAAGLLMAGVSAASATGIRRQVSGGNTPQKNTHSQNNIYAAIATAKVSSTRLLLCREITSGITSISTNNRKNRVVNALPRRQAGLFLVASLIVFRDS